MKITYEFGGHNSYDEAIKFLNFAGRLLRVLLHNTAEDDKYTVYTTIDAVNRAMLIAKEHKRADSYGRKFIHPDTRIKYNCDLRSYEVEYTLDEYDDPIITIDKGCLYDLLTGKHATRDFSDDYSVPMYNYKAVKMHSVENGEPFVAIFVSVNLGPPELDRFVKLDGDYTVVVNPTFGYDTLSNEWLANRYLHSAYIFDNQLDSQCCIKAEKIEELFNITTIDGAIKEAKVMLLGE